MERLVIVGGVMSDKHTLNAYTALLAILVISVLGIIAFVSHGFG